MVFEELLVGDDQSFEVPVPALVRPLRVVPLHVIGTSLPESFSPRVHPICGRPAQPGDPVRGLGLLVNHVQVVAAFVRDVFR